MQPTNNILLDFIKEIFLRFATKSPKFFKVFQGISGLVTAVAGLPGALMQFHIEVPAWMHQLENPTVGWVGLGFFICTMLTSSSTPVAIDSDGKVLSKSNDKALPFSSAVEQTKAAENGADKVTVTKV